MLNKLMTRTGLVFVLWAAMLAVPVQAQEGGQTPTQTPTQGIIDKFGLKESLGLAETQNYEHCFSFDSEITGFGWSMECGSPYGGPTGKWKFEYDEPVLVVEAVTEPGTSAVEDVPGQNRVEQLMGGMSASGSSTAYAGAERNLMPTSSYQPQAYFDVHVWGLGPLGRYAATKRSGDSPVKAAKDIQPFESISCDLIDRMDTWYYPVLPDLQLEVLAMTGEAGMQVANLMLFDWGLRWYAGWGALEGMLDDAGISMDGMNFGDDIVGGGLDAAGNYTGDFDTEGLGGIADGMGSNISNMMEESDAFAAGIEDYNNDLVNGFLPEGVTEFASGLGVSGSDMMNIAAAGLGGPGAMAAESANTFTKDLGDDGMMMAAAGAIAVGYALQSDDPEEICAAKEQVAQNQETAQKTVDELEAKEDGIVPEASYLPPGYPAEVEYDTCHFTGSGHYSAQPGQIAFRNCHPEGKAIAVNCNGGGAWFMSDEDVGDRGINPNNLKTLPEHGDACREEGAASDGSVRIFRAPRCDNGLSFYAQGGYFPACDSESVAFKNCTALAETTAEWDPSNYPGTKKMTGRVRYCASGTGQVTINHLAQLNEVREKEAVEGAQFSAVAMKRANADIDAKIAKEEISCEQQASSGSDTKSQVGGALTAAGGAVVAGYALDYLSGLASDVGTEFGDNPQMKEYFEGAKHMATNFMTQIPGADAVTGFASDIGDGLGGMFEGAESGALGDFMSDVGDGLGAAGDSVSGFMTDIGDSISSGAGSIGDSLSETFSGMSESLGLDDITDSFSFEGMEGFDMGDWGMDGFGEFAGVSSFGNFSGALSSLTSIGSGMMNTYEMIANDGLNKMLDGVGAMFDITAEVFPVYLSETQENAWRDEKKSQQKSALGPLGTFASGLKSIGCEAANFGSSVTDMVGVGRVFDGALQDTCLSWGPVQPLVGQVPTSGNDFPAGALAQWRGYQKAKVFLAPGKKEKEMWRFNLSYPHHSRCFDIGTPSARWESRGMALEERKLPGLAGDILNNVSGFFSNFGDVEGGLDYAKMAAGMQDTEIEDGKFIATYWKKTGCKAEGCLYSGDVLEYEQTK